MKSYVQILFKNLKNFFVKDEANVPNKKLIRALRIKNSLTLIFLLILIIFIGMFVEYRLRRYLYYRENFQSLQDISLYHYRTIKSLKEYYLVKVFEDVINL